ncbi:FUSC family protein [Edaphovirga cremea]|uniref:FUSC family protein n=1 Tax=Edaphovirga cremea TaxID=2267246 RepID=UPI00398A173E
MRLDKKISALDNLIYSNYRIMHGLRIALAFILTFLIVRMLGVPEGSWPLITLVVVMGPISFWGNVLQRALQRIAGTLFGAISGFAALWLELYSLPLMLVWCGVVMFVCGYLTLGKRPYMALLIGITLGVVCGGTPGDMHTALWRGGDVIFGSILALLFTSIYPQRAFIHWRMQMSSCLHSLSKIYSAYLSPNMVERPHLENKLKGVLTQVVKMRALIAPSSKETRIQNEVFEAIQTVSRNLVCTLELLIDAYWASRESHFIMINAKALRSAQLLILHSLETLSDILRNGEPDRERDVMAEMNEVSSELKQLMQEVSASHNVEAPIYGYVWLSMEMTNQLKELGDLITMAMRR